MYTDQSAFELWNYTFTFMALTTLTIFIVDMIGHKYKSISGRAITITLFAGTLSGELCMSILPLDALYFRLSISMLVSILVTIGLLLKMRTTDEPDENRRAKRAAHLAE